MISSEKIFFIIIGTIFLIFVLFILFLLLDKYILKKGKKDKGEYEQI
jgi:cell division protein FtsL